MRRRNTMSIRWATIVLMVTTLAACKRAPTPTPTPVATPASQGPGFHPPAGALVASGEIVPPQATGVSFTVSGRVRSVSAAVGDTVQAGDVLATLETASLESDVAKAQAAVAVAEAQLALLTAPPRPAEIAAAQARLEAAQAALAQAAAQRDQPGLGATEAEVTAAQAQVMAATADQREADEIHDLTMTCVTLVWEGEEMTICPALGVIEEGARHSLHVASEAQAAAQAELDALLAGAGAEVRTAQAGVAAAAAQRDAAAAQLALVQAQVPAEAVAVAQAKVAQAQAAVQVAEAALGQATLRAPCAGTVTALEVTPGEAVMPGQLVLTLAQLGPLQAETTDLSERQVGQVSAGQEATVYVEALDAEAKGRVVHVAPRATTAGGDVVYPVRVELDEQPLDLRWGMSVEVAIAADAPASAAGAALPASGSTVAAASGEIVPAQEARLSFPTAGRLEAVRVAEGDAVQPGDVLATLETPYGSAQVAQAEATLKVAQAQLALLQAPPRPEELASAQALLEAAEAALAQAAARRDQLAAGAAEAAVAAARVQLAAAQAEEKAARDAFDQLDERQVEDWEKEVTILRFRAAEQNRAAAEAQVTAAEADAHVQIRAAQAAVARAAAQRDQAQAQLDLLQAGPGAEEIAAAQAAIVQAEVALAAVRADLDQSVLHAPFAGTVTELEASTGETRMPGQAVLTLADLRSLRVETTDLSEMDVGQVASGQQATVYVEALGREIAGHVASIEPKAGTVGGDVVYKVVVELEEQPPGLRWGMSVDVEIMRDA